MAFRQPVSWNDTARVGLAGAGPFVTLVPYRAVPGVDSRPTQTDQQDFGYLTRRICDPTCRTAAADVPRRPCGAHG